MKSNTNEREAVILSAARTPVGRFLGQLQDGTPATIDIECTGEASDMEVNRATTSYRGS